MADFVIAKFQVFFEKNVLNLTCVRNQGHLHAAKYCVADVQDDLPCGTATGSELFLRGWAGIRPIQCVCPHVMLPGRRALPLPALEGGCRHLM